MTTEVYEIDGKKYKIFNLLICGKYLNVASYELESKMQQMIENERYHEVRHIDELYRYSLPLEVDESNEDEIRESIEDVYEE